LDVSDPASHAAAPGLDGKQARTKSNESTEPPADTAGEASPNEQYEKPERRA
jgi:hypothetical protein